MKVVEWDNTFTEGNHISNNPKMLTEHIRVKEQKAENLQDPTIRAVEIRVENCIDDKIVILKGKYWLRFSEYQAWVKAFKHVHIIPEDNVLLKYVEGMCGVGATSYSDYYTGVIIFKRAEKERSKELKLTKETTAKELEDHIYNILHGQITPGSEKREAVFTIGEYGAILFHRIINSYLEIKGYVVQDISFRSTEKELPGAQFIKYLMPNGISIKINIKEHQSNMKIDEVTGFPVESTILKFEEII